MNPQTIDTARHAMRHLVPGGAAFAAFHLLGVPVLLAYRLDAAEVRRRRDSGCHAALCDGDQLDTLMSLPVGLPVPVRSLTAREQRQLDRMCAGTVDRVGGDVVRRAVRPLRVDLAVVAARSWRAGLPLAGRFAPFTARFMWLPKVPGDADDMWGAARRFGVGVAAGDDPARVIVAPAPYRRHRHTVAAWRFVEQAFGQVPHAAHE